MAEVKHTIPTEERLYCLKWNSYVQYDGIGPIPPELAEYIGSHDGDLPPYIPLPRRPVEFRPVAGAGTTAWPGHGPLPGSVLQYVMEHGSLPRNTSEYFPDDDGGSDCLAPHDT